MSGSSDVMTHLNLPFEVLASIYTFSSIKSLDHILHARMDKFTLGGITDNVLTLKEWFT